VWERVDARLRERHQLPLSFFASLYFVSRAPDTTMRLGDLAQALRVTVSGTSRIVDRIEQAGLLARQPDPDDRRAIRAALIAAGNHQLTAATNTYEPTAATILDAALSPDEQQQMHDHVTRLPTTATTRQLP
jgi:DNA-binding MarR family transcriptional regulator